MAGLEHRSAGLGTGKQNHRAVGITLAPGATRRRDQEVAEKGVTEKGVTVKTLLGWVLVVVIVLCLNAAFSFAWGQTVQPFVAGGASLLGGGMTSVGAVGAGGVWFNTHRLLLDPEFGYITGGKANDAVNTSSAGHTRYASTDALLKFKRLYIGPGASWGKLYTPAYTKSSWHPTVTGGFNCSCGYFDDLFVSYVTAGSDHANGMKGLDTQVYWYGGKHLFLRADIGTYWGHETVIPIAEGGSAQSVASEYAQRITSSEFTTLMGWRF